MTAASGMDVLSHALESYTSVRFDAKPAPEDPTKRPAFCGSNPISDVWCEQALELVGRYLRRAVMNGRDLDARYHMALASTAAGTGFGNAGTHLPHANAYPVAGAVENYRAEGYPEMPMVPHGQAVSSTAAAVFRWTYPGDPGRHLRAAELLSGQTFTNTDGSEALAHVLSELMSDIGMPAGLRTFGYDESASRHARRRHHEADPSARGGAETGDARCADRHLPGVAMTVEDGTVEEVSKSELRTVVASSLVGTTVEWYDFFLYGTAAGIVFPKLFFPSSDPAIGTLLAFTTFAVGFVARPVGGLIFGHIGDRIGRKNTLVATMLIMGVATFLIGVIPTYAAIGITAPILLVVMRVAQGIAVGGEWGGAVLMAVEYAPRGKRGLYGSMPQIGLAIGLALGTGVFALVGYLLPDEAFLGWGWRIAFMLSAILVGVGLYIRLKVMETPAFRKLEKTEAKATVPAVEMVKDKLSRRHLFLGMGSRWAEGVAFNLWAVFAISYATGTLGLGKQPILLAVMAGAVTMIVFIPVFGKLADRFDRRHLYTAGLVLLAAATYPALVLMGTGNTIVIGVTIVVVLGVIYPMVYAPEASLFAELFPTRVRYTGISVVYQLSGIVASGLTPLILAYLLKTADGGVSLIVAYVVIVSVISAVSTLAIRKQDLFTDIVDAQPLGTTASAAPAPTETSPR